MITQVTIVMEEIKELDFTVKAGFRKKQIFNY